MTSRRVFLACIAFSVIAAGLFLFQALSKPTDAQMLQAEQEIYALLLAKQRNAYSGMPDKIQLVEFTNLGEFQLDVPESGVGIFQSGQDLKFFPNLEETTWLDFQKKNSESHPITTYLPDISNVVLVNPLNGKQLFWWVSFSRIGFNSSMKQALVLIGDCRGESCYDSASKSMYSTGTFWLLEKKDEEWAIINGQDVWHIEAPAP